MVTKIEEELNYIGNQLRVIAGKSDKGIESWEKVHLLSEGGKLAEYVAVGDTLDVKWHDGGNTYSADSPVDVPMLIGDLNHTVTYEDGTTSKATGLEWLYCTPKDVQFDEKEALIGGVALTASTTYYFTISNDNWGNKNGHIYHFTPSVNIPANAMGVIVSDYNASSWDGKTVTFYADGKTDTALTTVNLASGQSGTDLGSTDGSGNINHYHRVVLGNNRWKWSALRQWMNSDKGKNEWWTQQHKWDRKPAQLSTLNGMLYGIDKEFLAQVKKVKIVTGNANSPDGGTLDTTYDKFFPLSLNEINANAQYSGEGETWQYYTDLATKNGRSGKYGQYGTYSELARASINEKTSTKYVWKRSCNRSNGNNVWNVNPSGFVYGNSAFDAIRVLPACYI